MTGLLGALLRAAWRQWDRRAGNNIDGAGSTNRATPLTPAQDAAPSAPPLLRRHTVRRDGASGYTLTEMLVVIAIIGLIAAALTPAVFGQMNRARAKSAELQLQTVAAAIEAFRTDVGRYPTEAEGLAALAKEPQGVEGWSGPYLRGAKAFNDPWGRPIVYVAPKDSGGFLVESLGADGKRGGTELDRDLKAPAE